MDDHLRIGDAEREAAAVELGEHYAEGRLTTEEHAERLDRIWASRTRGELAPIFRDLPGRYGPVAQPADRRPASRRGVPGPGLAVLAVLAVLVVLTAVTHLPLFLAGVLVLLFLAARRRRHHWSR
ncbi:MAG TPA: DUF1707 domain-containing protein [Nocardioides sp.]|nr:DUF1707 domain-containing protein [Nocardioides sp.]